MADSKKMLEDFISGDEVNLSEFDKENYILEPLLEEINLIQDQSIRYFTRSILLRAGLFWDAPSSYSDKYNPPDEHKPAGLITHTKRVVRIILLMAESYNLPQEEKDMILSAALLHDITKFIQEDDESEPRFDIMYPYTVDKIVRFVRLDDQTYGSENQSTTLYIDEDTAFLILRLIRTHLGPWSPIPETIPATNMEMILHIADHFASKLHYVIDGSDVKAERWLIET